VLCTSTTASGASAPSRPEPAQHLLDRGVVRHRERHGGAAGQVERSGRGPRPIGDARLRIFGRRVHDRDVPAVAQQRAHHRLTQVAQADEADLRVGGDGAHAPIVRDQNAGVLRWVHIRHLIAGGDARSTSAWRCRWIDRA